MLNKKDGFLVVWRRSQSQTADFELPIDPLRLRTDFAFFRSRATQLPLRLAKTRALRSRENRKTRESPKKPVQVDPVLAWSLEDAGMVTRSLIAAHSKRGPGYSASLPNLSSSLRKLCGRCVVIAHVGRGSSHVHVHRSRRASCPGYAG